MNYKGIKLLGLSEINCLPINKPKELYLLKIDSKGNASSELIKYKGLSIMTNHSVLQYVTNGKIHSLDFNKTNGFNNSSKCTKNIEFDYSIDYYLCLTNPNAGSKNFMDIIQDNNLIVTIEHVYKSGKKLIEQLVIDKSKYMIRDNNLFITLSNRYIHLDLNNINKRYKRKSYYNQYSVSYAN